jgi:hypothetical protein
MRVFFLSAVAICDPLRRGWLFLVCQCEESRVGSNAAPFIKRKAIFGVMFRGVSHTTRRLYQLKPHCSNIGYTAMRIGMWPSTAKI